MPNSRKGLYLNVTLTDIQLASCYYPLLIEIAKKKQRISYGELVQQAKEKYPDQPVVQNAIAVSTGRRLDVVRMFTSERDLPDLTSLVVNRGSGECGVGFTRNFDPDAAREEVFSFDWSAVTTDFDNFLKHTKTAIKQRKAEPTKTMSKAKEREKAVKIMFSHYQQHKASLPHSIRESREKIIDLIMEGFSPEEAFALVKRG